ncbi:hypothetical protein dsat_2618 [Alkalidesulfovibrio alkalitolerans DSM 16529]|jgi:chaperone modulatory protein CbpM|uniref:MerR family transcriptional regulator n=1 Tax=Alkalidesulfovibrio alkalitolerans DSM 16529 TaxID=1121439 RepID=S7ULQ3_9BACT|nr:chaperone modulator CbpM [Alkalidesulfovibrio alkalitolerans]EPR34799.1 hypothetical protein dsat_2618 [Alkalidesulfovibrio alkalitolerans DSM 16529]
MIRGDTSIPARSRLIAWAQVIEMASIGGDRIAELIELGWIEPVQSGQDYLFRLTDVYRMKKLNRLCNDIGMSTIAGTIVVDLLDRIERLQNEIAELRRLV